MASKVYVLVDNVPAELLGINSSNSEGKYLVHIKGTTASRRVHEVGTRVTEEHYNLYNAIPAKQPAKRSKKNV